MSYDLVIRSDDEYSCQAHLLDVRTILLELPGVQDFSEFYLEYEQPSTDTQADIYLEYIDEEGKAVDWQEKSFAAKRLINCVRICIPYEHMDQEGQYEIYKDFGHTIAKQLQWKLYDEQLGCYV